LIESIDVKIAGFKLDIGKFEVSAVMRVLVVVRPRRAALATVLGPMLGPMPVATMTMATFTLVIAVLATIMTMSTMRALHSVRTYAFPPPIVTPTMTATTVTDAFASMLAVFPVFTAFAVLAAFAMLAAFTVLTAFTMLTVLPLGVGIASFKL